MESILQRLTELDEIANAILIGKDGLLVAGALQSDDEEMLGATSAAVFDSLTSFTTRTNGGGARHAIIETDKGTIQFAEVGELILIVTTHTIGNLGRVRMEMKKASQQISELVAAY
jgi:uncharacterized protein